jgi:hypothetical protein
MRAEISLTVTPSDRRQLKALIRDHNAPQKHVWRAESVDPTTRESLDRLIDRAPATAQQGRALHRR